MPKKSLAKNYLYNLGFQILAIILPLITTPYLSRVLGAENIGIYSFTLSIVTYFILFGSLGTSTYGQREIAYVSDNKEKRSKTFYEILIMRITLLLLSMAIFYPIFCISNDYSIYYKILLFEIISECFNVSWYFQGVEKFKNTVIRNSIVKILSVVCIFIFVKTPDDLSKYFLIYVLSNLFGNLTLWFYLPKEIEKIKIRNLEFKKHLKPALALFIPQIAVQVYTILDKTMIGAIVADKTEVGYYEQAQKIIKLLLAIATSLGTVMMPRIANTFAKKDTKKLKEYLDNSFSFILMITLPMMLGIVSVATKFVPIFYGAGYDKVATIISVISPIIVIIGLSNVIGTQYLLPTKQQKKFTVSVVTGAIVNFILNLIFINLWQSIGASIATVLAEVSVTTIQLVLVRKEIKIVDILKLSYKYIIASIVMMICSIVVGLIVKEDAILSVILQITVSIMVYFGSLLLMRSTMLLRIIRKIIKK